MAAYDPLSIRQLEVFVALLEQGSFTRAANALQLSQSTVSGHVADLERRLGVRLVERERGGIRPTPAGDALLRPARDVLRAERSARMAVEELSGLLRGTLAVGGSTIPSSYLLPRVFGRFHERYPGVALQLVTGDSREVMDLVLSASVEVGVVGAPPTGNDLTSTVIGRDRLILILGPDHPLADRKGLKSEDLLAHPLVMREKGSGTRSATDLALLDLLGAEAVGRIEVACEVGSTESLKAAVRAGLGAAFISELAVRDELAAKNLVSIPVKGFDVQREFYLVTRPEQLLSPAARAFRELALADSPG